MNTQKRQNRNYQEHEVVRQLARKQDIHIEGKYINVIYGEKAKNDIGIRSKGKIDFLTRYCGYVLLQNNSSKK